LATTKVYRYVDDYLLTLLIIAFRQRALLKFDKWCKMVVLFPEQINIVSVLNCFDNKLPENISSSPETYTQENSPDSKPVLPNLLDLRHLSPPTPPQPIVELVMYSCLSGTHLQSLAIEHVNLFVELFCSSSINQQHQKSLAIFVVVKWFAHISVDLLRQVQ